MAESLADRLRAQAALLSPFRFGGTFTDFRRQMEDLLHEAAGALDDFEAAVEPVFTESCQSCIHWAAAAGPPQEGWATCHLFRIDGAAEAAGIDAFSPDCPGLQVNTRHDFHCAAYECPF